MSLLECHGVGMRFGGATALNEVELAADLGAITGLIGPNGAGKTTMFNIITGLLEPTSGRVRFDNKDVSGVSTYKRARMGIARTFQRLELFTSLSVRDNIRAAGEIRNTWRQGRTNAASEAERIMDLVGIANVADREISEIPTGTARRVEVGRALMTRPRVLLLDEPASGQDETETEEFGLLLKALAAQGMAVLLVEHDMTLVMQTCSTIHVLDFGRIIATGSPDEIRADQSVLRAYLGQAS